MTPLKGKNTEKTSSIIKVLGVGGGGSNAVNYMFKQGITGVDFAVCNTDRQALEASPVPTKIQLGTSLTDGRGAGSKPQIGREACIESIDEIKAFLSDGTKMLFITAGMGGGTGTGAAPVVAKAAQELDILTVAIVTLPFSFEGRVRGGHAVEGLSELRKNVDTIIIISNDKLAKIYGNLSISQAFGNADTVLTMAAKGIAEVITLPGFVNVDFEDVNTVMRASGAAVMGSATTEGADRALRAVETALQSPLLEDNDITGAQHILVNVTSGRQEMTMDELNTITNYVQEAAGDANLIWGHCFDDSLAEKLSVTVIATGFETNRPPRPIPKLEIENEPKRQVVEREQDTYVTPQPQPKGITRVSLDDEVPSNNPAEKKRTNLYDFDNSASNKPVSFDFQGTSLERKESTRPFTQDQHEPYVKEMPRNNNSNDDRNRRLRDLNSQLSNNPNMLNELENEPAYLRKRVRLDDVPHSSEPYLSKWAIKPDEDGPEFRENNSFLHDNVD